MDFTEDSSSRVIDFRKKKAKKKNLSEEATGESSEAKQEEMEKSEAEAVAFPPTFSVSEIKNKQRRHLMFMKLKQEKRKVRTAWQKCLKNKSNETVILVKTEPIVC